MVFDLQVIIAWLMFLALIPLAIGMFYRAWKIGVRREFRFVAPWQGSTLPHPERWANWFVGINTIGGITLAGVVMAIVFRGVPFGTWAGAVGLTLWIYYALTQLVARKARRSGS